MTDKQVFSSGPGSLWKHPPDVADVPDSLTIHGADAVELSLPIAGVGSRSYAFVIDWHIRVVLALAWGILAWLASELLDRPDFFEDMLIVYVVLAPPLAIYFLYHPLLEIAMHGRTPGKRMAGVRIVTLQGHTPGVGALLIRNIFRLIDALPAFYGLGLVVAMLTRQQVRIGDLAAGTLLIHEEKITAKVLERAAGLLQDRRLTPQQQELLQDLLERWTGLDRAVRIRLAVRLLENLGETPPAETRAGQRDKLLHRRLKDVAGYV